MGWRLLLAWGHALGALVDSIWLGRRAVACVRVTAVRGRGRRCGCVACLAALSAVLSLGSIAKAESLSLAEFAPFPAQDTSPVSTVTSLDGTAFRAAKPTALGQGQVTISSGTTLNTAVNIHQATYIETDLYNRHQITQDLLGPIDGGKPQASPTSPDDMIYAGLVPVYLQLDLFNDLENDLDNDLLVPGADLLSLPLLAPSVFVGPTVMVAIPEPGTAAVLGLGVVVLACHRGISRVSQAAITRAKTSACAS